MFECDANVWVRERCSFECKRNARLSAKEMFKYERSARMREKCSNTREVLEYEKSAISTVLWDIEMGCVYLDPCWVTSWNNLLRALGWIGKILLSGVSEPWLRLLTKVSWFQHYYLCCEGYLACFQVLMCSWRFVYLRVLVSTYALECLCALQY